MLTQHFYHEKIRKCVAVFGTLFNNLYVIRNNSSGQIINQLKVPLSYAPKQKFLDRIRETEDMADAKLAIKLPRMSFEMAAMYFDPSRQLPKVNNFTRLVSTDTGVRTKFFTAVPYILNFQLNILTKTNEDAVQILEQIIPYFNPSYTITMKPFSDYNDIKEDIPISLIGISFNDDYENTLESRRTIIYTLDFELKTQFFGPIADSKVIRKAIVDFKDQNTSELLERVTVEPNPIDLNIIGDSDFNTTVTFLYPGEGDTIE
jgi:hypothetical protein